MSWNGYPKRVRNSVIKRLDTNKSHSRSADDDDRKKIWLDLPYSGKLEEKLVTSLIKKLKWMLKSLLNTEQTNYLCSVQLKIE